MKPVEENQIVVERERGHIPLSQIKMGDFVLTHKGRFRQVLAVHDNGELPIVRVNTWSGRSVLMAPDHPVLSTRGWVDAGNLRDTDFVGVVSAIEDYGTSAISKEEARLLGYLIGDGSLTGDNRSFVNNDDEIIEDFITCATQVGFDACIAENRRSGRTVRAKLVRLRRRNGFIRGSNPLSDWLKSHDIFGKSSYTKSVPAAVMNGTTEIVREFLTAYWDCDGTVNNKGLRRDGGKRLDLEVSATTVFKRFGAWNYASAKSIRGSCAGSTASKDRQRCSISILRCNFNDPRRSIKVSFNISIEKWKMSKTPS